MSLGNYASTFNIYASVQLLIFFIINERSHDKVNMGEWGNSGDGINGYSI